MSRSPVTDLLEQFKELNEVEQNVFLDMVAPEAEAPAPKQKQKRKPRAPRTTGLPKAVDPPPATAATNGQLCAALVPGLDVVCGNTEDNPIHDPKGGYGGYHPFSLVAPPVEKKSRRKTGASSSTVSSEIETETATAVAASGGD